MSGAALNVFWFVERTLSVDFSGDGSLLAGWNHDALGVKCV